MEGSSVFAFRLRHSQPSRTPCGNSERLCRAGGSFGPCTPYVDQHSASHAYASAHPVAVRPRLRAGKPSLAAQSPARDGADIPSAPVPRPGRCVNRRREPMHEPALGGCAGMTGAISGAQLSREGSTPKDEIAGKRSILTLRSKDSVDCAPVTLGTPAQALQEEPDAPDQPAYWKCPECAEMPRLSRARRKLRFKTVDGIAEHVRAKHTHVCPDCWKWSRTAAGLAEHRRTKHPDAP